MGHQVLECSTVALCIRDLEVVAQRGKDKHVSQDGQMQEPLQLSKQRTVISNIPGHPSSAKPRSRYIPKTEFRSTLFYKAEENCKMFIYWLYQKTASYDKVHKGERGTLRDTQQPASGPGEDRQAGISVVSLTNNK